MRCMYKFYSVDDMIWPLSVPHFSRPKFNFAMFEPGQTQRSPHFTRRDAIRGVWNGITVWSVVQSLECFLTVEC